MAQYGALSREPNLVDALSRAKLPSRQVSESRAAGESSCIGWVLSTFEGWLCRIGAARCHPVAGRECGFCPERHTKDAKAR